MLARQLLSGHAQLCRLAATATTTATATAINTATVTGVYRPQATIGGAQERRNFSLGPSNRPTVGLLGSSVSSPSPSSSSAPAGTKQTTERETFHQWVPNVPQCTVRCKPASSSSSSSDSSDTDTAPPAPKRGRLAGESDEEVLRQLKAGKVHAHALEALLAPDLERAVSLRRLALQSKENKEGVLEELPFKGPALDYSRVHGACAENVIGYVAIPVGVAGPLLLDGSAVTIPLATTEGCLIASTHRGCKALTLSGGVTTRVIANGMTRAPLLRLPSVDRAASLAQWLERPEHYYQVAAAFNSTSRFARLTELKPKLAGRYVHLRFKSVTGDAMGMNMVSKGVEKAMELVHQYYPDMEVLSLSGNFCTDKKPSAVNWLEGRGKSVVGEAIVPADVIRDVLKTSVDALVDLNINKNLIGSALAGSIGGNNAHASNIVTAIYLATGQDPAQNVESSNCLIMMEKEGTSLRMSATMPSIEVGTVGGGTHLGAQKACLSLLGVQGASTVSPGLHAERLARIVLGSVMAGELSLMSALAAGHLVKSHLKHNRKKQPDGIEMGHTLAGMELKPRA